MTVELAASVGEQLQEYALKQGRAIDLLVEEAVREYLVTAAITDLDSADVAEAQIALIGELQGVPAWEDEGR
jgi:hypothetical protein